MDIRIRKQELRETLDRAKAMADVAEAQRRDFTAFERAEVARLMEQAKAIKAEIKAWEQSDDPVVIAQRKAWHDAQDEELKRVLLNLGAELPLDGQIQRGNGGATGGAWSKAFMSWRGQQYGQKALLTPSGSVGVPSLSTTIPAIGERLTSLLQVIPTQPTSASSVEYLREDTRTHAADTVAAGAEKPTSTYELSEQVAPAQVIAHLSEPVPRHYFSDAPGLSRYLDYVLREGLELALVEQLVNGSGVAPDLEGMLSVTGTQAQPWDGVDMLSTTRRAITLLEVINIPLERLVFAFSPYDWETMELLETSVGGAYKMNDAAARAPINRQTRQLWGVPVALTTALDEGTGLLFDRQAVELYEHEGVQLTWSENVVDAGTGKSDFVTNQIRWRAEGRWSLAIYQPSAIVEIALSAGS